MALSMLNDDLITHLFN